MVMNDTANTNSAVRKRLRKSVVWTPIPPITWLFPFIGHLGVTDSEGKVHDFGGSYYINVK